MKGDTTMDVYELLELFSDSIKNEIFHNVSDDTLQDILLSAVDQCKTDAIDSYKASLK